MVSSPITTKKPSGRATFHSHDHAPGASDRVHEWLVGREGQSIREARAYLAEATDAQPAVLDELCPPSLTQRVL